MTQQGRVYNKGVLAGIIEKDPSGYTFSYDTSYLLNPDLSAISLTLPKSKIPYHSATLFAFFFGLLAEGSLKDIQCRDLKIDENDHFTRLLKTCSTNVIGSVTVQEASK